MSEQPNGSVDEDSKKGVSSRAPAHTKAKSIDPEVEAVAVEVETHSQLDEGMTMHAMIKAVPGVKRAAVAAMVRCLGATKWRWDKETETTIVEPDYQAQLKAALGIAAYSDGLPPQTTVNYNHNTPGKGSADGFDLSKALASPATRAHLRALLDASEATEKKVGPL